MASSRGTIPKGFDHIHRVLGAAMRAAPKAAWPPRPHLGGPAPELSTRSQVDVGAIVARHARDHAPDEDGRAFLAKMAASAERVVTGRDRRDRASLDKASKTDKRDDLAHRIGRLVLRAAYNHRHAAHSARNTIGQCVERAAEATMPLLAPASVRGFLEEIDAALLRLDLAEQLRERKLSPTKPIERVLSRPLRGKSLGLAFAALEGGSYGLLVKLKQRWTWHEGDRATMFATVPDEYMEHVADDLDAKRVLRQTRVK